MSGAALDALVPVKRLEAAKSRLIPGPDRSAAGRLTLAMLEDVLSALFEARRVERVGVVTPDAEVAKRAEALGARALLRPDPGLNASLDAGAAGLARPEQAGLLVVLGDVAGATARDLDAACAALAELAPPAAVLCPARDGGTAALARAPHDALPTRFGPDSAARHREAAERAGVAFRELALPSLAIDLDHAEDVRAFLRTTDGGRRTRLVLRELGWTP